MYDTDATEWELNKNCRQGSASSVVLLTDFKTHIQVSKFGHQ